LRDAIGISHQGYGEISWELEEEYAVRVGLVLFLNRRTDDGCQINPLRVKLQLARAHARYIKEIITSLFNRSAWLSARST